MNTNINTTIAAKLAADVVLFTTGVDHRPGTPEALQVLLIQRAERAGDPFSGYWALPGGHVDIAERFEEAGRRELWEETGIEAPSALFEVGVWDHPDRDPRGRVISVAYFGVLDGQVKPAAADDAAAAEWWPVEHALDDMRLAFDHHTILSTAIDKLTSKGFAP